MKMRYRVLTEEQITQQLTSLKTKEKEIENLLTATSVIRKPDFKTILDLAEPIRKYNSKWSKKFNYENCLSELEKEGANIDKNRLYEIFKLLHQCRNAHYDDMMHYFGLQRVKLIKTTKESGILPELYAVDPTIPDFRPNRRNESKQVQQKKDSTDNQTVLNSTVQHKEDYTNNIEHDTTNLSKIDTVTNHAPNISIKKEPEYSAVREKKNSGNFFNYFPSIKSNKNMILSTVSIAAVCYWISGPKAAILEVSTIPVLWNVCSHAMKESTAGLFSSWVQKKVEKSSSPISRKEK